MLLALLLVQAVPGVCSGAEGHAAGGHGHIGVGADGHAADGHDHAGAAGTTSGTELHGPALHAATGSHLPPDSGLYTSAPSEHEGPCSDVVRCHWAAVHAAARGSLDTRPILTVVGDAPASAPVTTEHALLTPPPKH